MIFGPDSSALVCLDLQRERLACEGAPATVTACRAVLEEARRRRWPVLHVHSRNAQLPGGRPIPGLEPLPSEAVFGRQGPSAFTNRTFSQTAQTLGGPLVLIGFSLADTVMATAFAAADRDLAVDVVEDAVGGDPTARRILLKPLAALASRTRVLTFHDLVFEDASRFAAANTP
ncbi:cysteine hydrolase family protein [Phenylobacterium sp.]|uniref:cysteine hydrolase family protein n=1 Tax=Phenylobacterium sp. TaxID=1871053 RepID=UPI002727F830|nr:isochorismatase family protein [Phenylobacterium sp.]MDO8381184.1 isochorismatase family protein [Phenylobacterium sp.]